MTGLEQFASELLKVAWVMFKLTGAVVAVGAMLSLLVFALLLVLSITFSMLRSYYLTARESLRKEVSNESSKQS